jgi:hypothetical protein
LLWTNRFIWLPTKWVTTQMYPLSPLDERGLLPPSGLVEEQLEAVRVKQAEMREREAALEKKGEELNARSS